MQSIAEPLKIVEPMTFLCIACYFKGADFLTACKAAGNTVYLLTKTALKDDPWPREAVDEFFYMDSGENDLNNLNDLALGLAHLMRHHQVDRIVALDDFDVEKAAFFRETFRVPGMGQTTARYFRDKLAMRIQAEDSGIRVPEFSPLFNDAAVNAYIDKVPAPWVVKPRSEASATGITKVKSKEDLWQLLDKLGEERAQYLIESFKPGDVYHVDALSLGGKNIFNRVSRYLSTPFEVAHGGGVFRSKTVEFGSKDDKALKRLNNKVMRAFGMQYSASHTEYIKSKADGKFYFLETAARVGGAHLAEMVEFSSGINLWGEWAKIETAVANGVPYELPEVKDKYAGILVSLIKMEKADYSAFNDPEIVWTLDKSYHVGLIFQSDDPERIQVLLDKYADIVFKTFHASAPAPDKSVH